MTDVGPQPTTAVAHATGINEVGTIVGHRGHSRRLPAEGAAAFVYDPTTATTSSLPIDAASAVNDYGLVAGFRGGRDSPRLRAG